MFGNTVQLKIHWAKYIFFLVLEPIYANLSFFHSNLGNLILI